MSDLEERNAAAVMQALKDQNRKLAEFQLQINQQSIQLNMLQDQLNIIKKQHLEDLAAKFGSGPTS